MQAPAVGKLVEKAASLEELGAQKLNSQQRQAVAAVLVGAGGGGLPLALFGPPGTGKTVTLVECALQVTPAGPMHCSESCWALVHYETSSTELSDVFSMSVLWNVDHCVHVQLLASCQSEHHGPSLCLAVVMQESVCPSIATDQAQQTCLSAQCGSSHLWLLYMLT